MNSNEVANQILDAVQHKQWLLAAALGLVALTALLRWLAPKLHNGVGVFLNSNRGGSLLVLASGIAMAIVTALMAGKHVSVNLLIGGLTAGVVASGGWNVVWDILAPNDKKPPSVHSSPTIPISKVS